MIELQAKEDMKTRVRELLMLEKHQMISTEERSELDHYVHLEHVMRLAKART
jgi:hypothetical protein